MRFLLFVLFFFITGVQLFAGVKPNAIATAPIEQLGFKENKKQWNDRILFVAQMGSAEVYLERTGIYYVMLNSDDISKTHPLPLAKSIHGHSYEVTFEGASPDVQVQKGGESPNYYNYFKGNDPLHWASHVHSYASVYYKNIYSGIDIRFYFENNLVKYEFIVHPGADASLIKLKYNGEDNLFLREGSLHIKTTVGDVVEALPYSYQSDHLSQTTDVKSKYILDDNTLSFGFPEGYDKTQEMIIDPTLIFSTYTGSTADNWGFTCTYDKAGYMYLGGLVNSEIYGGGFPVTPGAFQLNYGGGDYDLMWPPQWVSTQTPWDTLGNGYGSDISIAKIDPTGTSFVYATYLGGYRNETPSSLVVNSKGELVIYARTYSPDYPVTANAFDPTYNGGADIAITVLSADGSSLVGSTFIGGANDDGVNSFSQEVFAGFLKLNYGDDSRGEVVLDANDNIYVASSTMSTDFPVTPGCYQSTIHGFQNGCIFKLNSDVSSLLYATYIGGSQIDACYSLALKTSDGTVYATGGTMSTNFPTTPGTIHPAYQGGYADGFIAHLSADGKKLLNSTYVGTNDTDQAYSVKLDDAENVYVLGQTTGSYPVTPGIYSNPNSGLFISKMKPGLDSVFFSTVVGNGTGLSSLSPTAFLVDTCGNIYICGWGGDLFAGYPWPFHANNMLNMPLTADAYQSTTDGVDFYIMVLSKNAQKLLYATYFGGNGAIEHVDGGTSRFDPHGIIYEAICDGCGGNSLTPTAPANCVSHTNNSPNCNELGFKIDLGQIAVKAAAIADPAATGCKPLVVNFVNNSQNAVNYSWNFETGNPKDTSNLFQPVFTFNDTGTFVVRLIASNPADCIPVDTAYTTVRVYNSFANASYSITPKDYCDSLVVQFNAVSSGPTIHYTWNFGDSTTSNAASPKHVYTKSGVYKTYLILRNDTACNPLDTVYITIPFVSRIIAQLQSDSVAGCEPVSVDLKNYGFGSGLTYLWKFDDGTTSTDSTVSHTYTQPGRYVITLIISSPTSCNGTDSAHMIVEVFPNNVVAAFTENPTLVTTAQPVQFTNTSTGATSYSWDFGDGTTSIDVSPQHTYTSTGTFTVCLYAFNGGPCPSSTCREEDIFFNPDVGVPNAFSPGQGENNILYVKGQGVQSLDFRVFNRWGQLVFETNDLNTGWDGRFKGVPQDMDVYAWTLSATLDNSETVKKSGNVTLLR